MLTFRDNRSIMDSSLGIPARRCCVLTLDDDHGLSSLPRRLKSPFF